MFFKILNLYFDVHETSLKLDNKSNRRSKAIVLKDMKVYFNRVENFCVNLRSHNFKNFDVVWICKHIKNSESPMVC